MKTYERSPLRRMVYASMFGALTALGAFIVIPIQPVPITLQTLFTGLAGALLGSYAGALSQIVYVLLGIIGLPVFSGGKAGLGIFFGPTGGYLIGFVVGAYIIGKIVEARRDASLPWIAMAILIGDFVIYSLGTIYLSLVTHLTPLKAIMVGVVPFLPGEILKFIAAALLAYKMRKNIKL